MKRYFDSSTQRALPTGWLFTPFRMKVATGVSSAIFFSAAALYYDHLQVQLANKKTKEQKAKQLELETRKWAEIRAELHTHKELLFKPVKEAERKLDELSEKVDQISSLSWKLAGYWNERSVAENEKLQGELKEKIAVIEDENYLPCSLSKVSELAFQCGEMAAMEFYYNNMGLPRADRDFTADRNFPAVRDFHEIHTAVWPLTDLNRYKEQCLEDRKRHYKEMKRTAEKEYLEKEYEIENEIMSRP